MEKYLKDVESKFKDKQTSEMGYRTDFELLLESFFKKEDKYKIHHDAKSVEGNKPDFVVLKNAVPILYIEAKDIGVSLDKVEKSEQMKRYFGYTNLILTDYLEFRFYRNGEKYSEPISIATFDINTRTIILKSENFDLLKKTILDFSLSKREPIKKGIHLAKIMGGKAQRIRDNIREMLRSGLNSHDEIVNIKNVVKENLISSLDDVSFADMYAQTLVYGLFAARYHDKTLDSFSRQEARDLVPKTNPFLASFFDHIAGNTFPDRLKFIVDEMCEVFQHADVNKLMHDFYKRQSLDGGLTETKDPVIHFYEDFLKEYDSAKKMEMGVFYTPKPVVQFIIRAVDEILKNEFMLPKGLADNSKVKKEFKEVNVKNGKLEKIEKEFHRVQVLDVATGTGTFLNEVMENIYSNFKNTQQGQWSSYVERDLLPRIHGFELMMASYTIAHLKLGMALEETGAKNLKERIGIYLTNTLDEPKSSIWGKGSLFVGIQESITKEAIEASRIKSEFPIMCVIGNPPYSGKSMNPDYTDNSVYKVEFGGVDKLKERNSKFLNDDYVKFIRFSESLIEKNGEGIVAMITSHGYIDNPTFRGMRWHLRKTFDKIYVLDLHGNSRKKEVSFDGGKDENVFDIMSGVAIIIGIKKSCLEKDKKLGNVFIKDIYGSRNSKFENLNNLSMIDTTWIDLPESNNIWRLEGKGKEKYLSGFNVRSMFLINNIGIYTGKDEEYVSIHKKFPEKETHYSYRAFDDRYLFDDEKKIARARKVFFDKIITDNTLIISRQGLPDQIWNLVFITNKKVDLNLMRGGAYCLPLSVKDKDGGKLCNLNKEIWFKINEIVGDTQPENILDYIYAILHSPSYRKKNNDFLKADFPLVPYPESKEKFWKLVNLGNRLRNIHLMLGGGVEGFATTFPVVGENIIEKVKYENEKVFINEEQYFGKVPEVAWNFYIGGYQPAQKWLKDRKERLLTNEDIDHYQKIIKVLSETNIIMEEIDKV